MGTVAENSNAGYKGELTPLERRLVACAAAGEELDCAPNGGVTKGELAEIKDWDRRKIRAEVVVALCTEEVPEWFVHPRRGLQLRGAHVVGLVDLSRAQLSQRPLAFHTCRCIKKRWEGCLIIPRVAKYEKLPAYWRKL